MIFLSDLHAGPGFGSWEWCTDRDVDRLAAFLATVTQPVVLLGDVFDHWQCPVDIRPPTMPALLAMGPAVRTMALLASTALRVPVTYVVGNHDDRMRPELLPPGVQWGGEIYQDAGLHAEHGHIQALFCAPDPDAPDHVPLGYFVSRLVATADRDTGSHTPSRQVIVRELLDAAATEETLPQALLDAVAARAGVGLDDPILMPSDLWSGLSTTVRQVRQMYRDLLTRFEARRGRLATALAIPAECGALEPVADALFCTGARTVIMGHTHTAGVSRALGRTYANAGAWCSGAGSWVEVDEQGVRVMG